MSLSLLGGMGWPFFACGQVIDWVDPFLCFHYWKVDWGSSSSDSTYFALQGFLLRSRLQGLFRNEGVVFDLVPFLFSWVFLSKDF